MAQETFNQRLSRISTLWSVVCEALLADVARPELN